MKKGAYQPQTGQWSDPTATISPQAPQAAATNKIMWVNFMSPRGDPGCVFGAKNTSWRPGHLGASRQTQSRSLRNSTPGLIVTRPRENACARQVIRTQKTKQKSAHACSRV